MDNQDKNSLKTAAIAFVLTLAAILAIGIPALFLIKYHRTNKNNSSDSNQLVKWQWEEIPAAAILPEIVKDEEGDEEQAPEIVIDEEDREYTHIITASSEDSITLGFAGDILFDDNYAAGNAFKKHGNSAEGVIGESLLENMRSVDVMMVNNEFPYSNGGAPTEGKTFTFRAKPETASILQNMGVDIVGLANNHAYDYGQQAFLDTLSTLRNNGIVYAGAGMNIEEASHPVYYVTENGFKIAIICATQIERLDNPDTKGATESSPGVFRCLNDSLLLEKVKEAKEKNAYVIVFVHWGTEGTTETDYLQNDQSREITEAGADVIIGAHPHVLQKIEYVNGKPVLYSLGNYMFNSKTLDTCLVVLTIHKDGTVNLRMIPALQSGCTVNEASGEDAMRIITDMNSMSGSAVIDSNGYVSPK